MSDADDNAEPVRKPIRLGFLPHLRSPDFDYDAEDLIGADREIWSQAGSE